MFSSVFIDISNIYNCQIIRTIGVIHVYVDTALILIAFSLTIDLLIYYLFHFEIGRICFEFINEWCIIISFALYTCFPYTWFPSETTKMRNKEVLNCEIALVTDGKTREMRNNETMTRRNYKSYVQ